MAVARRHALGIALNAGAASLFGCHASTPAGASLHRLVETNPFVLYSPTAPKLEIDANRVERLLVWSVAVGMSKARQTVDLDVHLLRLRLYVQRLPETAKSLREHLDKLFQRLTDDGVARQAYSGLAILEPTTRGINWRIHGRGNLADDLAGGSTHPDKALSVLGELSTPAALELIAADGAKYRLRDAAADSMERTHFERELPWTVEAFCRYLIPDAVWKNRWEETLSLEVLGRTLLDKPRLTGSVCLGVHRLRALAMLLVREEVHGGAISSGLTTAIREELGAVSRCLEAKQSKRGCWDADWASDLGEPRRSLNGEKVSQTFEEVSATGHMLEWMSLVPRELCPSIDVMRRAGDYLLHVLSSPYEEPFGIALAPTTHAVIALARLGDPQGR